MLLFSFSGYGLQVDDLRGSAGEGFDEAMQLAAAAAAAAH